MVSRYSIVIIVLLCVGCSVNPVTGERDFVLMSEQEELALGRQHSQQVMKAYRRYDDPELQQYVQSVGDRVARVSHRQSLIYRFTLLDSTQVNAFALPGGYIYITRGLLVYLNSEAELAAVLGHELGHVTARHSVRQHSLATTTNIIGSLIAAASGVQGAGQLTNMLGTGIVRGYGREHELEADGLGVQYLINAGYRASAMRQVISTLKNQELFDKKLAIEQGREPRAYHGVFSTHPDNDTRLQQVLSGAGASSVVSGTTGQDTTFLKKIESLTFGDSEKDGIIRGRHFYHPEMNFKLTFPSQWLILNKPNAIAASTPNNDALMQLTLEDLNKKITPKEFLRTRLGITKTLSEKPFSVGQLAGYQAIVNGKTPYGQGKVRIAVVFDGLRAFVFFATTKRADRFVEVDKQVLTSIKSFSRLNAKDRKVAKELKVVLVKVGQHNKSIKLLAKNSPITHHVEDQLRLLNDLFPNREPKLGDLIKIVR
ncbi:M48 family metalloprotease [Cycloclasticus pugetii]|uniref:M48 family metalloprotease n=1 Tax=Cycloclasticus pugetii TaxID=34068 RepID=UPI0003776207|nr:M48 family metalloprotease [Cycloclasticus pugetii]